MFFFEYGPMMGQDEIHDRCPAARFKTVACLPYHALEFPRCSAGQGCGVVSAVANKSSNVWGVVYEISDTELEKLDKAMDFKCDRESKLNPYNRIKIKVFAEDDPEKPIEASIYIATPDEESCLPNSKYKKLLIKGATERKLPQEYQAALKRIQVSTAMDMPANYQLPLFVYGALKPGFPAYQLIKEFVDNSDPDCVEGELLIRDGLPLLSLKANKNNDPVEGFIIQFKNGQEQEGYRAVCNFEPPKHYVWGQINTKKTGRIANTLKIRMPSKGNPITTDCPYWQLSDDPVFGDGLDAVEKTIKEVNSNQINNISEGERFFRSQMAYLLLWSILERLASFCIGPNLNPHEKIKQLHKLPGMSEAVKCHVKRSDTISDSRDPDEIYELKADEPEKCFLYYYQVRCNLSHRGKGAFHDFEKVNNSLQELVNITRCYLQILNQAHQQF